MPTARNVAEVEDLKTLFSESTVLISTDYRGLSVARMNALRRALQKSGVRYRIAKNTLARIAADEIDRPDIKELIDGPVGWVYTTVEPSAAARTLVDHINEQRIEMGIRGALMGARFLTKEQVEALAKLPGREQLLGMLLGQMNAPIAALAIVLAANIRGLATVLQRIAEAGPRAAERDEAVSDKPAGDPEAVVDDAPPDGPAPEEPESTASNESEEGSEEQAAADDSVDGKPEGEGGEDEN